MHSSGTGQNIVTLTCHCDSNLFDIPLTGAFQFHAEYSDLRANLLYETQCVKSCRDWKVLPIKIQRKQEC